MLIGICVYILINREATLEDCEAVHRPLGKKLDEIDPIPHAYVLEVSSRGWRGLLKKAGILKRPLVRSANWVYKPWMEEAIEGVLEAYDGENVTVLTDKDNLETTL